MDNDLMLLMAARIDKLRVMLKNKNLDAALITKRENYGYISGFNGTSAFLIITLTKAMLLTDFRYIEQAQGQAPLFEVIQYEGKVSDSINRILKGEGVLKLGFEEGYVTYETYAEYTQAFKGIDLLALGGMVEELRIKKDEFELEIIRKAVHIADNAFTSILSYIKPGVTEIDIATELEYNMKKQGALGASFEIIVASGKRSSLPHGVASNKIIELGDTVTLDYGAIYSDFCSDMTRTVFVGRVDNEIRKIYSTVLEAQLAAIDSLRPGITGAEADFVARSIIDNAGYKGRFGHGLGHGVGREIHEAPRLSPMSSISLDVGMVVTVEPGIYIPGLGGVRIEDMVVITDSGRKVFTNSTKQILVL